MRTFRLHYSTLEDCNCACSHDTTFHFEISDFNTLDEAKAELKTYDARDFEDVNHPHTSIGYTAILTVEDGEIVDDLEIESFNF